MREVLEHLVRVHDVERVVGVIEVVHVRRRLERHPLRRLPVSLQLEPQRWPPPRPSMPTTRPGATRPAMSRVIVPGPQPTSSTSAPATNRSATYAAELSTVRQRCDRSTLSWCPWV